MPLKIAIVLPTLQGGGAEKLHVLLAESWARQGIEVEFVVLQRIGALVPRVARLHSIVDLGAPRIRQAIRPLASYFRRARPDIVLAAMWPLTSAVVLARGLSGLPRSSCRLFLSDHTNLTRAAVGELHVSSRALRASIGLTYRLADGVIAVSEGVKRDLCHLGRLPLHRVQVIYNPAAIGLRDRRAEAGERERLWGRDADVRILSVGTLKPVKDHETLIRAFSKIPAERNAKLIILGDGPLRTHLEQVVADLGLEGRVAFAGFVDDPYPWFLTADVFVLSSRWEGFGNVLVEALECGLRVVSTDCESGPAEILGDGKYGRLVPVGDIEGMTRAILAELRFPRDPELLRRRAEDFSVDKISQQYLEHLAPMVERRAQG